MSATRPMRGLVYAFAFLTRIPVPQMPFAPDALTAAAPFFPFVGLVIGAAAALTFRLLSPHVPTLVASLATLLALMLLTGGLHEDGLADAADALGGGLRDRTRILEILRDSRIGTYGACALFFSLAARLLLIASLPSRSVAPFLIAAHVLCRWSSLPLAHWLPSARATGEGLGSQLAGLLPRGPMIAATLVSFAFAFALLRTGAVATILATCIITWLSGRFYAARLGGVTGDCFGATNQLVEVAVLCCGVWHR